MASNIIRLYVNPDRSFALGAFMSLLYSLGYSPLRCSAHEADYIISSGEEALYLLSTGIRPVQIAYTIATDAEYHQLTPYASLVRLVQPDHFAEGQCTTSATKAADAWHCYNRKWKVDWECLGNDSQISSADLQKFVDAGNEMVAGGLLHSPTDGCISLRTDNNSIYVTQTGTAKHSIVRESIVKVTSYRDNFVRGFSHNDKRPSSSTPWHWRIYQSRPNINAVVHGHCREITYSKRTNLPITSYYAPYGTEEVFESASHILALDGDFAILKGHGEVVLGENFVDCLRKYHWAQRIFI